MFLSVDDAAEVQPTWREVGDGSGDVELDVCADCRNGMPGSGMTSVESRDN